MKNFFLKCTNSLIIMAVTAGMALPVQAHRDERFEKTFEAADQEVRSTYQYAHLLGQVGKERVSLGDVSEGEMELETALTVARQVSHNLLRDQVLNHLANEVASTDAFERALELRHEIRDLELRTKLGWKLVNKLGKADAEERAQALLDEILLEVLPVEDDLELRAELLAGTGANHRFTDSAKGVPLVYEAYGLAQTIESPYERGLFFNEIGANMMDIDHRDRARRLFERSRGLLDDIESPLEQARFLAMLGGEQAEKGRRDAAAGDLERGVQVARQVPAGEDRNDVLSELARNFGQSYRFERGVEVADTISDPYHRAEGYLRIAKRMYQEGQQKDALALLERIELLADDIESPYRRGIVQRKLASEWASIRENSRALALLDKASQAAGMLKQEIAAAD